MKLRRYVGETEIHKDTGFVTITFRSGVQQAETLTLSISHAKRLRKDLEPLEQEG